MAGQGANGNGQLERHLHELAEERRRLAMIIDGTAAGTWEWNVQTGEMRVNARWAEIVGYRLEELEPVCQKTFLSLVHPDDIALSDAALQEHFDGRSDNYACLVRMRHKNGQWMWVHDRGRVFEWDAQGRPLWMAGAHADVTELQQARHHTDCRDGDARGRQTEPPHVGHGPVGKNEIKWRMLRETLYICLITKK